MPQPSPTDREFDYTPRWRVMIACAAFFGICGLVIRSEALSNDRGLTINGIIELSPANATIFYWVLTWLSFSFVALAALMAVTRLLNPHKIVLATEGLYAPKWAWSRTPTFIAYKDVLALSSFSVSRQEFLKIVHVGGKQNVTASLFGSKYAFDEFCQELARRLQTLNNPPAK